MFRNKNWILVSALTLLAAAALGLGGWSLYRSGYNRGVRTAQVRTAIVEMGPFHLPNARGRQQNIPQHPFFHRGAGQGPQLMPGQPGDEGYAGKGTGVLGRPSAIWGGAGRQIIRLLFAAGMFGLLAYVVVKLFQPGGWQLSFGPLQAENEERSAMQPESKTRSGRKN